MLNIITNYHTHTVFCDGKDTAADMASAAFKNGVSILGFSSHAMYPFSSQWHIPAQGFEAYCTEISNLKKKYSGKMDILLGFEADYIPGITMPSMSTYKEFNPDYLIGSVHYIGTPDGIFGIDDPTENVQQGISSLFHGDGKAVVCEYFSLQREMLRKGDFLIWGHPDVVRKRNGLLHFFDERDDWYRQELKETARAASKAGIIAEINTGAIARKTMDSVYPSAEFLSLLHEENVPITLSSDAHSKETILTAFDRATLAAKQAGYSEVMYINKQRQVLPQPL